MEGPTEEAEAFIPMEGGRNMLIDWYHPVTTTLRRKAAKRTEPWYLKRPPPPQDEDVPAAKKPRLENPITTATAEAAATMTAEADVAMTLPPFADIDDANTDSVTDTDSQSTPRSTGVTGRWTREEDAELTSAVETCKMKWGNENRTDWFAVAALVPSRTKNQCFMRWKNALKPSIAQKAERPNMWKEDEDNRLRDAVQMLGSKDWVAITAMLPGRTKRQCSSRWHNVLNPSIDRTAGSAGPWTTEEDNKLKDSIQVHHGKDWIGIAALVPGRTKNQCRNRWHNVLNSSKKSVLELMT